MLANSAFFLLLVNSNVYCRFLPVRLLGVDLFTSHKGASAKDSNYPERWFNQSLDHFNSLNQKKWSQRYFSNHNYFKGQDSNPVFLKIGGESPIFESSMNNGAWIRYAKKYGAYLFQLEHRYYGKSHPTEDVSPGSLQYLSSQQALADAATFIEAMKDKYNLTSNKWIAFGNSYAGSLAAWLRLKYPHLVRGAVSSSAPLKAVLDFEDYFRVVTEDISQFYDEDCTSAIGEAIVRLEDHAQDPENQSIIAKMFNLCDEKDNIFKSEDSVSHFFQTLADIFGDAAQYSLAQHFKKDYCKVMTDKKLGSPLERLAHIKELVLGKDCLESRYEAVIEKMANISWNTWNKGPGRQWYYQKCTEFGFFHTSTRVFGRKFPISFFLHACRDLFGDLFTQEYLEESIKTTNINYGGYKIHVSNVAFVHGTVDPWRALGLPESNNNNSPVILIPGSSHCADAHNPREEDSAQLKAARQQVSDLIGVWLNISKPVIEWLLK